MIEEGKGEWKEVRKERERRTLCFIGGKETTAVPQPLRTLSV